MQSRKQSPASTKIPSKRVQNDHPQVLLATGPQDPPMKMALLGGRAGGATGGPEPCPPATLSGPQETLLNRWDQPERSCAAGASTPPGLGGGRAPRRQFGMGQYKPQQIHESKWKRTGMFTHPGDTWKHLGPHRPHRLQPQPWWSLGSHRVI